MGWRVLAALVLILVGFELGAQPPAVTKSLTCLQSGAEVCSNMSWGLSPVKSADFEKLYQGRQEKFIDWIRSSAQYVQSLTGLPASVIIAQAGIASEWGTSAAFGKHNNIFKFTCWRDRAVLSGQVKMGDQTFTYSAKCSNEKAAGQMGKIMTFANREDSLLAYVGMLLTSHSRLYRTLQEDLKRAPKTVPIRPPTYRGSAPMLTAFSADPNYQGALNRVISQHKLADLESSVCWVCLNQKYAPRAAADAPADTQETK